MDYGGYFEVFFCIYVFVAPPILYNNKVCSIRSEKPKVLRYSTEVDEAEWGTGTVERRKSY